MGLIEHLVAESLKKDVTLAAAQAVLKGTEKAGKAIGKAVDAGAEKLEPVVETVGDILEKIPVPEKKELSEEELRAAAEKKTLRDQKMAETATKAKDAVGKVWNSGKDAIKQAHEQHKEERKLKQNQVIEEQRQALLKAYGRELILRKTNAPWIDGTEICDTDGNLLYTVSAALFLNRRVLKLLDPMGNVVASAKENRSSKGMVATIAGTSFHLVIGSKEGKAEQKRNGMVYASPFDLVADIEKGRCIVGKDRDSLLVETMGCIHKMKEAYLYLSPKIDEPLALLMLLLLPTQWEGAFCPAYDRYCERVREHSSEGYDGLF